MLRTIKKRMKAIEGKILSKLPFWPDDSDGFIAALGRDPEQYRVCNPNGSLGCDALRALSDSAADDWRNGL